MLCKPLLAADGKVRYVAAFVITKPVDMSKASGLLWHDVPNRGRPLTLDSSERAFGDVGLASAWQGDNADALIAAADASNVLKSIDVSAADRSASR